MKSIKLALSYGFLLWLLPFIVSFLIFPLKRAQSPLFETIMAVTVTFCVVVFANLYYRRMESGFLTESIKLGILWFGIGIILDLLMFMWGPMKMTFANYMLDIGLTYGIFPIVTIGFGYSLAGKQPRKVYNSGSRPPDSHSLDSPK